MGLFSCKHKYGDIREDGYQYCKKCNLAVKPSSISCQHKYKKISKNYLTERINEEQERVGVLFISECKKCGDIKKFEFTDV